MKHLTGKLLFTLSLMWAILIPTSCSKDKPTEEPSAPTAVILDTDIGSSTDDLFAMAMLYKAVDAGVIDLKAIMVNREGIASLRMTDVMNTFYGHTDVPIGYVENGVSNPPVFIDYWKMAMPEDYPDEPRFDRTLNDSQLKSNKAVDLYRKILSSAADNSVVVISIGFATNLSHLLQSGGDSYSDLDGTSLVRKKVKALYIQAGDLGDAEEPDYNFNLDPENARNVVNNWPTPIWFSPQNTGQKFDYVPENVLSDFTAAGNTDCPIYHVYKLRNCNTGQRMWDVCAVMQFLYPELFTVRGPLQFTLDDNVILKPGQGDSHYMTYTDTPNQDARIMELITNLAQYRSR